MNNERRRSRRIRFAPARQRMVDPDAWTPDGGFSPQPTAEELPSLPVPTLSDSSSINGVYDNDADAPQPLITQAADPVAAAIARRQNTVVTVTSTQFSGVNPNSSSKDSGGLPIVTIAVSASVGVFLAVSIVGCWWWFCKRPYTRRRKPSTRPSHKNQTSTSSVAPLNSKYGTKTPGQGASPRSREKPPGPTTTTNNNNPSAPPSHARSTSLPSGRDQQQGQQQQQRRPGQPAVPPPAVLPSSTPPNAKRRSPPGQPTPSPSGRSPPGSAASSSPSSTVVEDPSTPHRRSGSGGKSYAPQKPSPLALGAERAKPKEKPKEKSKVNEWGTGFPVSNSGHGSPPSSPTRSSSSGHGYQSTMEPPPVPPVPSFNASSRQSANMLAIPEPAAHYHSRRDRISVLSDSSYYALDPDEEDGGPGGGQHVYMGLALGGDEPSPIPEEYFSPNYGEDEEEEELQKGGSRMQRQQEEYFSNRQSATDGGGYGQQQQQQQQQQSYTQQSSQYSQYRPQGGNGYGYGYGYSSNPQSYGR